MALETEMEFFKAHKKAWLPYWEGKWLLIYGEEFFGGFSTMEEAYAEGLERFGSVPMLIMKLEKKERPKSITRFVVPANSRGRTI